jgi:hypothetical protein
MDASLGQFFIILYGSVLAASVTIMDQFVIGGRGYWISD